MDGILTRNSAVPQQVQRVRRKAALSARAIVSAAARGESMIIPDDLTSGSGSHSSGYQSSMEDKKKKSSTTTTTAAVASTSSYSATSSSVTLASVDHKPPSSNSIVSSLLLPAAAASHSLSRTTINAAAALSVSSLTSIGFSGSGSSDAGSDYSSSGVSNNGNNTSTSSSSSSSSASSSANNKKKTALSAHAVEYLKNWMMSPEHVDHPYPTEDEKVHIMNETGIVLKQLTNWFVNNRKRYWKPKVEELRRRQEGDIVVGDGSGEDTRAISNGDGNVLIRSSSPEETGCNTNTKRSTSTRNTKKRSSNNNNNDEDGLLPTAKKMRHSNKNNSITDGMTTIITPTPTTTMLLPPPTTTAPPSYLPSLRDDMKMNMTREKVTNRSGTSVISNESGSGRGSCTEEESGDDIDDANQQHVVSNPLFDKSSYSSLDDVMESSSSSSNVELRTVHQQAMNMIDMDYSFNPLDIDDTITTNDHRQQDQKQQQEEEHICSSILPHSCTDPKNRSIQPCALCSACRDWNLGEFCPWDLTGILGDLSTDQTMLQEADGSESLTVMKTTTTAGAGGGNVVVPIFSDEDGSSTHNCETISTEEGEEEVMGGGTTSLVTKSSTNIDDTTTTTTTDTTTIEPTMMFTTMYSNLSVPQEISHSTSAMNFMADIESWD